MIISPIVADFVSEGRYEITGRGTVYTVRNPKDCSDFNWLINQWVRIDGAIMEVRGIERFAIVGTYLAGKPLGLLVRQISPSDIAISAVGDDKSASESV